MRQLTVRVKFARRISQQCRDLSAEAAAKVDAELARKAAGGLPWSRLGKILTAAIMNADPELAKAKLERAKFDRRVWLSESEHGLRTLVIRADQGDQVLLYALIDRIAEILQLEGDTDPVDQRRAKAAGWLARPEDLTVLLYRHAGGSAPPPKPGPEPSPSSAASSAASARDADEAAEPRNIADDDDTRPAETEPGDAAAGSGERWCDSDSTGTAVEPVVPQPPDDFPSFDWDRPEPPFDPGVSDVLLKPRNRWFGTEHLPGPEPYGPAWCYEPPDDRDDPPPPVGTQALGPPGPRLGSNVPQLVDYLTTKGLKPARPRVIMNVHLNDQTPLTGEGVVRSEECGTMLLSQLIELLGRHHCAISLRPVLDPANLAAVDAYEIPQSLREAVRMRHPASVFPFSSRTGKHLELDHTVPHTNTPTPAGQTRLGNLGPLAKPEHKAKTAGVWHVEQPHPGVFLWRSPHGHYFLVTNQGTQALGPKPAA